MKKNKWIFIRGLGRGRGHWGTFISQFESAVPDDRVYWLDLPGNGILNKQKSPLSIPEYIASLEVQLKATDFFQIDGPTYGVGLSLGAMVLTEWTQLRRQQFDKIFLINTSAANFSKPWRRISIQVLVNSVKQLLTARTEKFELNSLLFTTNLNEKKITTEYKKSFEKVIQFSNDFPIKKMNIFRQLIAASKYSFPEQQSCSVILLRGACDRFVNSQCSVDIQNRWGCVLETHPSAGHDIAFEDAGWVIAHLKKGIV